VSDTPHIHPSERSDSGERGEGAVSEHEAVCDACAERGLCEDQGDASVCRKCRAFHERAVLAAAEALYLIRGVRLGAYPFPTWEGLDDLDRAIFRTDAGAAIDAYFGFPDV
jgi:hypothetical protein